MNTATGYTILPFSLQGYSYIRDLYLSAYGAVLEEQQFLQRYDTSPLGHEVIGFIAVHDETGVAAAYYGVFPVQVLIGGTPVLAAQSGDTMTHAEHRKRGLFILLAKHALEECRRKGIRFVFGQPNASSRHGLIHSLQFTHQDDIVRYDLKTSYKSLPLARWFNRTKKNSYLRYARMVLKKRIVGPPEDFTSTLPAALARVRRNRPYLHYKDTPDKFFVRFGDVILWIKLDHVFRIGEVSHYEALTPEILRQVKKTAFMLGYPTISFHLNMSLPLPPCFASFAQKESEPSCFYYLDEQLIGQNLLLTAADFDTW